MKKIVSLLILTGICLSSQIAYSEAVDDSMEVNTALSTVSSEQQIPKYGKDKVLKGFLQNEVSTSIASVNDPIVVILSENWVERGQMIAAEGSVIRGTVSAVGSAGYNSKNGYLQINFTSMETPDGKVYGLNAEEINIQVEEDGNVKKTLKKGGKLLGGAIVGVLLSGNSSYYSPDPLEAAVQGMSDASAKIARKVGSDIIVSANTVFEIKLLNNISLQSY